MIVTHDLKMNAVRHMMTKLRADGPCLIAQLKSALVAQCTGVDRTNVDEVFDATWPIMNHKRCPMVEKYDIGGYFDVAARMYDSAGNYKGN